jgi:hypothetical protein
MCLIKNLIKNDGNVKFFPLLQGRQHEREALRLPAGFRKWLEAGKPPLNNPCYAGGHPATNNNPFINSYRLVIKLKK